MSLTRWIIVLLALLAVSSSLPAGPSMPVVAPNGAPDTHAYDVAGAATTPTAETRIGASSGQ